MYFTNPTSVKKSYHPGKYLKHFRYDQDSPERKSLSLARSKIISANISEHDDLDTENSMTKLNSIKFDEQKYNLEGFKRRNKNSRKIISKAGLKWNAFNTDQNYNSNLPLISKTRTNLTNESYSIEQINTDMFTKNRHKNQLLYEQPYTEL